MPHLFDVVEAVCFVPLHEVSALENLPPRLLLFGCQQKYLLKQVPQDHHVRNFNSFTGEEETTNMTNRILHFQSLSSCTEREGKGLCILLISLPSPK